MVKEGKKPPRATREGGRQKVIAAARAMLRSKVKHEVSRKDIAQLAGVVPGLLTYYFDTKSDLILAVTRPVMGEAIEKLFVAIGGPESAEERLKRTAALFIDFARENGSLLDLFVEAVLESGDEAGLELIQTCLDRLRAFFAEAVEAGIISGRTDPRRLLLAMWGMCRLVGETPPLPFETEPVVGVADGDDDAEFITNLILNGTRPPPPGSIAPGHADPEPDDLRPWSGNGP